MKTDHLYYAMHHVGSLPKKNVPLLILLHGYGSNEADMLGLGPYFDEKEVNCVSVRAPFQLNKEGFAWFDIERSPDKIRFDYDQAMKSLVLLNELVRALKIEFESENMIIAGFSQGATMAMASGFKTPKDYSGIVALSGLCSKQMFPADPTSLTGLPVFVSHGIQDEVIPIQQARDSKNLLSDLPVALDYFEYEMDHTISSECLSQLQNWIFERLDA